jgi:excisionase family DNA binding protein
MQHGEKGGSSIQRIRTLVCISPYDERIPEGMKTELERSDIEAIAGRVAEIIMPKMEELLARALSREEDELLTIEEAAAVLQRSKGQIYQWVHSATHGLSDFPFSKQGKQLRFSKRALMNWTSTETARKRR